MKIYTRTGDDGHTGLFGGPRVEKDDARIEAYGAVDELNALLGHCRCVIPSSGNEDAPSELDRVLADLQRDLFAVGAELATPEPAAKGVAEIDTDDIARMESLIDSFEANLPPLKTFVLPGGGETASRLHVARTTCRRAERRVWTLVKESEAPVSLNVLRFLNRLSDLLFVLARYANLQEGREDTPWIPE